MSKKIFSIISLFLLIYLGWTFFDEYLIHHAYYEKMLSNWTHVKIVLVGIIFSLLPVSYIVFAKKKKFFTLLACLFWWLFLFMVTYINIKADLYGWWLKVFLHTLFLLGLAIYTLVGLTTLWARAKRRFLNIETNSIFDVLLNLWLWLGILLLIVYFLVIGNLLYGIISWILFLWLWVLMRLQKDALWHMWSIVSDRLDTLAIPYHPIWNIVLSLPFLGLSVMELMKNTDPSIWIYLCWLIGAGLVIGYVVHVANTKDSGIKNIFSVKGWLQFLWLLLLVLSIWYLFNGFQLAYLPYSTAWDANHAYMFFPKMWSLHHGYYRNEIRMTTGMQLWYMYITFFFSLFGPLDGFLWISVDTIAIEMNFWSGIFVLLLWLGLVLEVVDLLRSLVQKETDNTYAQRIAFLLWWLLLITWLTSGMGMFLVAIDNKLDMGVLALIILALYSWFVFLKEINDKKDDNDAWNIGMRYVIMSWVFFALAALAKPTALFDVALFGIFLWILWFGILWGLGALFLLFQCNMAESIFAPTHWRYRQYIGIPKDSAYATSYHTPKEGIVTSAITISALRNHAVSWS